MPDKPMSARVLLLMLMDFPTASTKRVADEDADRDEHGQLRVLVQGDISHAALLNRCGLWAQAQVLV